MSEPWWCADCDWAGTAEATVMVENHDRPPVPIAIPDRAVAERQGDRWRSCPECGALVYQFLVSREHARYGRSSHQA